MQQADPHRVANKGTAVGDTMILDNTGNGSGAIYTYSTSGNTDSGYVAGTNVYGDKGFAERYDFNGGDSTVRVLGVLSFFTGTYGSNSTRTVNIKVWSQGQQEQLADNIYASGYPDAVLAQQSVPVTALNLTQNGADTLPVVTLFSAPTAFLTSSFFSGYDVNYSFNSLNGDTIALVTTANGDRTSPIYTVSGTDTIINVQNAVQFDDDFWYDEATENVGLQYDLFSFPIVEIGAPLGIDGITRRDFTFYGSYPNPAGSTANFRIALKSQADVTIRIMDMTGRALQTIKQSKMAAGEHAIPVNTASLPSGNYLVSIFTSNGDGIANKFSVIH